MDKKDEALKLALEALEETRNALAWFYDSYPQDVTEKGNELLPHVETILAAIRKALSEQPAQQQEPVAKPKLIGWRTENFLWETNDIKKAQNWEPNIGVLPIFEGDPNTQLTSPASKPLTDEQIDKKFEEYADQFDTDGDEWLDMGVIDYFRAGFKAAHGIKGGA
jgi:hypothetical protein